MLTNGVQNARNSLRCRNICKTARSNFIDAAKEAATAAAISPKICTVV